MGLVSARLRGNLSFPSAGCKRCLAAPRVVRPDTGRGQTHLKWVGLARCADRRRAIAVQRSSQWVALGSGPATGRGHRSAMTLSNSTPIHAILMRLPWFHRCLTRLMRRVIITPVDLIAVRWRLTGKDKGNRGRCPRVRRAVLAGSSLWLLPKASLVLLRRRGV